MPEPVLQTQLYRQRLRNAAGTDKLKFEGAVRSAAAVEVVFPAMLALTLDPLLEPSLGVLAEIGDPVAHTGGGVAEIASARTCGSGGQENQRRNRRSGSKKSG
jgi:hypothetical protein